MAAGPNQLVVTSTASIRSGYQRDVDKSLEEDDNVNVVNVVTDFSPDFTIPAPQLRHVAFSSDGDFLVVSAEEGGGLATYGVGDLLARTNAPKQLATDQIPVRALAPNPNPEYGHYFAAVLDSGGLIIVDVVKQAIQPLHSDNVTCVAWSAKGRGLAAGMKDGSVLLYKTTGDLLAAVPVPPEMEPDYTSEYQACQIELVW